MRATWVMSVALIAVLGSALDAQRRNASTPATRTGPAPASPAPAPAPAARSSLIFVPPPDGPAARPPSRGRFLGSFPLFWYWDGRADEVAEPAPPALEDAPSGGLQLDVLPWRARVYLDGVFVGRVDDFTGYYRHLNAAAGSHDVVIVETGYEPLVLRVLVQPGRTTTFRATLAATTP